MKPVMDIDDDGNKRWFVGDRLHREDGPAIEHIDGYRAWYINGMYHREDGPAVEWGDGTTYWFIYGKEIDLEYVIKNYPEGYGPWSSSDLAKLKLKYL